MQALHLFERGRVSYLCPADCPRSLGHRQIPMRDEASPFNDLRPNTF